MANPSPHKARQGKKRRRKPGNLVQLQCVLWSALAEAERVLYLATADDMKLRAIHAIAQASGQYAKLLEVGEIEARIAALEQASQEGRR